MFTIHKIIDRTIGYDFSPQYNNDEIVFFDIETTGFAAERTMLYLIGCTYYSHNEWHLIQWFADNQECEEELLNSFFSFIDGYKALIHYNGSGFDIPYILKKCRQHKLPYNFNNINSIDIYKEVLPFKKFLKLENLKQKTVEQFLEINRTDTYSGAQLIPIYSEYLKCRYVIGRDVDARLTQELTVKSEEYYSVLLCHNEEDLKGLLQVTKILNYPDIFKGDFTLLDCSVTDTEFVIDVGLDCNLPKRISYGTDTLYFSAYQDSALIKVQLYENELKFFYSNYKDYYYLPKEDMAVHKSVAFYVDKDFRTKAKAATCYSKKNGRFIPQYQETISPYFKNEYNDKITYIEICDDFLNNKILLVNYITDIIQKLRT